MTSFSEVVSMGLRMCESLFFVSVIRQCAVFAIDLAPPLKGGGDKGGGGGVVDYE